MQVEFYLFQQINKDKAEDKAGSDVFREIESLKSEVEKYNTNVNTDRGSLNQILTDMRAAELQVGEAAREINTTLFTGGGQKQGVWGEINA